MTTRYRNLETLQTQNLTIIDDFQGVAHSYLSPSPPATPIQPQTTPVQTPFQTPFQTPLTELQTEFENDGEQQIPASDGVIHQFHIDESDSVDEHTALNTMANTNIRPADDTSSRGEGNNGWIYAGIFVIVGLLIVVAINKWK
jgi:hypothetical protein